MALTSLLPIGMALIGAATALAAKYGRSVENPGRDRRGRTVTAAVVIGLVVGSLLVFVAAISCLVAASRS